MIERSRLDLWCDRTVVGLLFAIVVAAPLLMGALRPQDFFWIEILTVCAGGVAALRLMVSPEPKIFTPAIFWLAVTFAAYAVARYWTADLEYVARKELLWVLTYLVIFFLALNHLRDPKRAVALFILLLIVAMSMSLFALRQHITGTNQVWNFIRPSSAYTFRGSGAFIYPNHFAGFLELLLPFGVAALFLSPFSFKLKLVIAYCTIWIGVGLYVSLSRAGWIAAGLGVMMLLPLILRNRKAQVFGFVIFVLLLLGGLGVELKSGKIRKRFETITGEGPFTDVKTRVRIWNCALSVWREQPFIGAGPGHFDYRFRPYRDPLMQMRPGRAHSDYLDLLADWGIAGAIPILLALGLFIATSARQWWAAFRQANDPPDASKLIVVASIIGVLSILAHAVFDYQMHAPANAILALILIGVVTAQVKADDTRNYKTQRSKLWLIVGILGCLLVTIGYQAQKSWREQHLLDSAATQSGPQKIAMLKAAFALEPTNFDTAFWIGESYRLWSWDGGEGYKELAENAMHWFKRASGLNPYEPFSLINLAMCLDWLKQHEEAESYYHQALALDPNNYYVFNFLGWHFFQTTDYERSKQYFVRAWELNHTDNAMALSYFQLLQNPPQSK
jgi:O-antigen ligase